MKYGEHLTPAIIFERFILPEIEDDISNFIWTDLYCGEGNLIFPILEQVSRNDRDHFFENRIYLFDIQEKMVEKCIEIALSLGVSDDTARKNIIRRDNLKTFPKFLNDLDKPVYHITNPPYLYLGHIRKNPDMKRHLSYFEWWNDGYQDLYQIAMINDLRNDVNKSIYIIPTNFLFGNSVSNKIRDDFLKHYEIVSAYIFEAKIFEFTGMNACMCFFRRRARPSNRTFSFPATKLRNDGSIVQKRYELDPKFHYRAGNDFFTFVTRYHTRKPVEVSFYFTHNDATANTGEMIVLAIDANAYKNGEYKRVTLRVNEYMNSKLRSNLLYIRTIDTGTVKGRLGLGVIQEEFGVNAIYVSSKEYRTHPIQIFFKPTISTEDQLLLRDYFSFIVESLRREMDSDFLTTYRYSEGDYARKYMGLSQVRALIKTFPVLSMNDAEKEAFKGFILNGDLTKVNEIIEKYSEKKKYITDFFA